MFCILWLCLGPRPAAAQMEAQLRTRGKDGMWGVKEKTRVEILVPGGKGASLAAVETIGTLGAKGQISNSKALRPKGSYGEGC